MPARVLLHTNGRICCRQAQEGSLEPVYDWVVTFALSVSSSAPDQSMCWSVSLEHEFVLDDSRHIVAPWCVRVFCLL